MAFPTLDVRREGPLVRVALNRPDKLNPISGQMHRDIQALCTELRDDSEARVVILTGAGRAFSAGADLSEMRGSLGKRQDVMAARGRGQTGTRTAAALEDLPQVTIAAVNGPCIGGGVVLALCCDLRLAAESAWFSIPEVELGIPLTWSAIPRLMNEVGPARALEVVATCERFSARQALEWGMLNYVVPDDELPRAVDELAQKILAKPALPVALTKATVRALKRGRDMGEVNYSDPDLLALAGAAVQLQAERPDPE